MLLITEKLHDMPDSVLLLWTKTIKKEILLMLNAEITFKYCKTGIVGMAANKLS